MATNGGFGNSAWGTDYFYLPNSSGPTPSKYVNIVNVVPAPGSFNISRSQTFTFTIKTKFQLNPNTTYVYLDNQLVLNGGTINPDFTVSITTNTDGISKDYTITPNYLFSAGEVFTLQISASDIYGNPSPAFFSGYIVVDDRPSLLTPIYPLDGYADVPLDLTLHFLVNQLAAPNSGLDPSTLNVYVDNNPAVLSGVIQSAYNDQFSAINLPTSGDITTPFEIVLDSYSRYSPNDIVNVKVSIKEMGVVPVAGIDGYILDPNGVVVGSGVFSISSQRLPSAQYLIILQSALSTYLLPNVVVSPGYQFKDTNGNIFEIGVVGVQEITVNTKANLRNSSFSFITTNNYTNEVQPIFAGYFQGVYLVDDIGDGQHMKLTWHTARTTRPDYDLAYLIYYSTTRADVFYEEPKLITQGRTLPKPELINGLDPQVSGYYADFVLPVGITYYFGVRATEYPHSTLPLIPADGYSNLALGLCAVDGYSFKIPQLQAITTGISGIGAIAIPVISTQGYAKSGGYILVGSEIMRYTALTPNSFIVALTGRGQFGSTIASIHNAGEVVKMYYGNKDDNTVIAKGLVSWDLPFDPHRVRPDLITTDYTLEDGYLASFEPYDYCGYHRFRPDTLLDGGDCSSYLGGDYSGARGFVLSERVLAQEEELLEVDGESVILLRRLWQGETCACRTSRRDSALNRSCSRCYGTGFVGGYVQYLNPRRDDARIRVHFAPSDEEIGMGASSGWDQRFKPNTWTLIVPSIKDRDLLVRFDQYNQNEVQWIYRVNSVSRGETVFGVATRQRLNLSRIDRTDMEYSFPIKK